MIRKLLTKRPVYLEYTYEGSETLPDELVATLDWMGYDYHTRSYQSNRGLVRSLHLTAPSRVMGEGTIQVKLDGGNFVLWAHKNTTLYESDKIIIDQINKVVCVASWSEIRDKFDEAG